MRFQQSGHCLSPLEGRKEGNFGVSRRFQQLRSYRDEIETRNRKEIPFSLSIVPVGSFSCRRTIDSPPQRRTCIERPGQHAILGTQRRFEPANSRLEARCFEFPINVDCRDGHAPMGKKSRQLQQFAHYLSPLAVCQKIPPAASGKGCTGGLNQLTLAAAKKTPDNFDGIFQLNAWLGKYMEEKC